MPKKSKQQEPEEEEYEEYSSVEDEPEEVEPEEEEDGSSVDDEPEPEPEVKAKKPVKKPSAKPKVEPKASTKAKKPLSMPKTLSKPSNLPSKAKGKQLASDGGKQVDNYNQHIGKYKGGLIQIAKAAEVKSPDNDPNAKFVKMKYCLPGKKSCPFIFNPGKGFIKKYEGKDGKEDRYRLFFTAEDPGDIEGLVKIDRDRYELMLSDKKTAMMFGLGDAKPGSDMPSSIRRIGWEPIDEQTYEKTGDTVVMADLSQWSKVLVGKVDKQGNPSSDTITLDYKTMASHSFKCIPQIKMVDEYKGGSVHKVRCYVGDIILLSKPVKNVADIRRIDGYQSYVEENANEMAELYNMAQTGTLLAANEPEEQFGEEGFENDYGLGIELR